MKKVLSLTVFIGLAAQVATHAQTATTTAPAQQQKSLAATMGVYVFPTQGQSSSQQSKDEGACYTWAVQNTGVDPFELSKQAQAQSQAIQSQSAAGAPAGSGARGAARGAAGGALFGAIGGDAGKGAAIGAAAGFVGGRMRGRAAEQQAQSNVQQATAQQMDAFKKAFSACMEGKKYTAKF